jgi:hypothetical protein
MAASCLQVSRIAEKAMKVKSAGISAMGTSNAMEDEVGRYHWLGNLKVNVVYSCVSAQDMVMDPDEALRASELLDTTLISALVNCAQSRRKEVIALLSKPNRCHIESSAVLLASKGNSFTEALLWLYRSHNEHRRVLNALTEDKCVGSEYMGAWSRDQFYEWTTEYLRWMWFHESDTALPMLALSNLRPLLEYNAEWGLSVLTKPLKKMSRGGSVEFGGKAVTMQDVMSMLESVVPNVRKPVAGSSTFGAANAPTTPKRAASGGSTGNDFAGDEDIEGSCPLNIAGVKFPLNTGRSLCLAYLGKQ